MSIFDDTSLDARVIPLFGDGARPEPSDASLRAAMLIFDEPSPAMLADAATWLEIVDELARAGLTSEMILRVALRATAKKYTIRPPGAAILAPLFAIDAGVELARTLCEELIAPGVEPSHTLRGAGVVALARLARAGAFDPRFEPVFAFNAALLAVVRDLLAALPSERRAALVLAHATPVANDPNNAAYVLDRLLAVRDLADSPALVAARAAALDAAATNAKHAALAAEVAAGTPRVVPARPTPRAQAALEYLLEEREAKRRAASIGMLAEEAWTRSISVDAPELRSMSAWTAAGETRQREVGAAVAVAVGGGCKVTGSVGDLRIAVFELDGLPYCLVPGGTVEMGFSPEEESAVRAAAAAAAGCVNHYELYESLLEGLGKLRPLTLVHIGPMLAAQEPREPLPPAALAAELETSKWRYPSEAEWEYLARGGVARELTYVGPDVPDDPQWLPNTGRQGVELANDFGMWGFGFEPELCADVWYPSHEGASPDGSPRRGPGPRVVRGGASQLYPFQATGEWHLLLSAMRTSQKTWEFVQSARFVIGIKTQRPS